MGLYLKTLNLIAACCFFFPLLVYAGKLQDDPGTTLSQELHYNFSSFRIATLGEFNLVEIEDMEQNLVDSTTPVLPVKKVSMNVPLHAEITHLEVSFSGEKDLGILNIPGFRPPSPMPDPQNEDGPSGYITLVKSPKGQLKEQYYVRTIEIVGYKQILFSLHPVRYDVDTKKAYLYTQVDIDVAYNAVSRGVLKNFSTYDYKFVTNEEIQTFTTIENTSSQDRLYTIELSILNLADEVVDSWKRQVTIKKMAEQKQRLRIFAPAISGAFRVEAKVYDGHQLIGFLSKDIRVDET